MKDFWSDVRYGIRMLGKSPAFTLIAIFTLAVGIGANAAVFSVVNAFILAPLPVRDPGRFVVVANRTPGYEDPHELSNPDFKDFEAENNSFSDMTASLINFAGLSADNRSERVVVTYAKGNYFTSLGLQPAAGRLLLPTEGETPGADPVVVLGYSYWQRRFSGDPAVVGKSVKLDGLPMTIVGVAPKGFFGTFFIVDSDAYAPLAMLPPNESTTQILTDRDERQLRSFAHLKPGVSMAQASASLQLIADRLAREYPATNKGVKMEVLAETMSRPEPGSAAAWPLVATIFLAMVGLVLLVTCVNVTNLLLARATDRAKEIAIRSALGAGRARLLRQLLTESTILACLGGLAGAALGIWLVKLIEAIHLPGDFPMRTDIPLDWRVFGFIALIAVACGLFAGIVPAWRATRMSLNQSLRESGRSLAGGGEHSRVRNFLVVAQAAGSLVVLILAGLFLRSLQSTEKLQLGFNPDHVLNLTMDVSQIGYDEERGTDFYRKVLDETRGLPGVQSASFAYSVPLGYYSSWQPVWKEGQEGLPASEVPRLPYNRISSDFFPTMGIEIVRGRAIDERDHAGFLRVAVVNETLAKKLWPGEDPIGHHFRFGSSQAPPVEVVGVARDAKYVWIAENQRAYFYVPLAQEYTPVRVLQVRATVPPATLGRPIEALVRQLDPDLPVFDVMPMADALGSGNGYFFFRVAVAFAAALGAFGLLLAISGVYGVVSYGVNQRTQEIGIRMALGAQQPGILRLVLAEGLKLVLIGLAVGLALSAGMAKLLADLLVNTSTLDPLAYAVASLVLVAVAALACYFPARCAMRVDPVNALRCE